jgi:hypothetical protein
MTETDLTRIESAIGAPLPTHYRDFLRDHSETLRAAKTRFPLIPTLYSEADDTIREHGLVTGSGMYRMLGDEQMKWPSEFLVVGSNAGDCWFINRDSPRERLWEFGSGPIGVMRCTDG